MEVIKNEFISKLEAVRILQKAYADGRIQAKDGCVSLLDDINALPAKDVQPVKWISVKDRLPENHKLVLCYAQSTTGEGNSYFLGAVAHGEFWFLKVNDDIRYVSYPVLHWVVTHWQPLPEPPKDGDAE